MEKTRILLVEDNPEYAALAGQCLRTFPNLEVDIAHDYETARQNIEEKEYSGIIVDIFFPKKTGSTDKKLGIEAFYRVLEILPGVYDISANLLASFGRSFRRGGQLPDDRYLDDITNEERINEGLVSLKEDIQDSDEAKQPLGILLMEELTQKGIPYVVATSGHHHDLSYEPIFHCFYRSPLNIGREAIIESYGDFNKSQLEYWETVCTKFIDTMGGETK